MTSASIYMDKAKNLWAHSGFQRYFRNTGWMFLARVISLVIAFIINAYMARYLGPANFGILNYVFSFVGLFAFMTSLGIENIASREIIKDISKKDSIIGTSFYLKLSGSIIAILSVIVAALISTNDIVVLGIIIMYSLCFIFSAFNIIETFFQSQVLSKYSSIVIISTGLISAVLKLYLMSVGAGIIWLTSVYVFESIIMSLGFIIFFSLNGNNIRKWKFNKNIAIGIIRDSWPLMISTVAWSFYMKIDQVMIKNIIDNEAVGIYAVAVKLSEFWYFLPSIICASSFPAIVNAIRISRKELERRISGLYGLLFWLAVIIAIFIYLFAYQIVLNLFGAEYLGSIPIIKIYVWAGISFSLGIALSNYLVLENRTKINAISTVVGAAVNVLLNYILIPKYGAVGAAFASIISYTSVIISVLMFKKERGHIRLIIKSILFPVVLLEKFLKK